MDPKPIKLTRARPAYSHRRDPESGAAAVEFALVVSLLLFILMGTLDYGFYFYLQHVTTNAAREGARAASLHKVTADAVTDGCATLQNYLVAGQLQSASCAEGVTCTVGAMTPCAGISLEAPGAIGFARYRVRIVYPAGSVTKFLPSGLIPASAVATSEMRF